MPPNKKSKPQSSSVSVGNIEDLIDDEATVEDFEEYNQIYPDLDAVVNIKNHCTSCFKHIGLSLAAVPKIRLHNVLKVTICKQCHDFYNSGEFERGEDGSELYCRWCGQGGEVYCCSKCIYVFCKECIFKNQGSSAWKKISKSASWDCFRCDSNQLLTLRARHHVFTNYLLNRQNYVHSIAKDPQQLKALVLEDMSTCCKPKTSTSTPVETTSAAKVPPRPPQSETTQPLILPKSSPAVSAKVPEAKNGTVSATPAIQNAKRPRDGKSLPFVGPLSKKLKMQEKQTPRRKTVTLSETQPQPPATNQKQAKPSGVKTAPVTFIVPHHPAVGSPVQSDDEQDIFSLMTPIVELDIPTGPEEPAPIDPLSLDSPAYTHPTPTYSAPKAVVPAAPIPARPQLAPVQHQLHLHPPQIQFQSMDPMPMLQFGGHFMAMDSEYSRPPSLVPMRTTAQVRLAIAPPATTQVFRRGPAPMAPRQPLATPGMSHGQLAIMSNYVPIQPQRPIQQQQHMVARQPLAPPSTLVSSVADTTANASMYHYVNGYKIDLKAASEMQSVTLPDGKVIHVRRHMNPRGAAFQISTQNSGPRVPVNIPLNSPVAAPPRAMARYQAPPNLQVRVHGPRSRLPLARPPFSSQQPPTSVSNVVRPRRKTTVSNRPIAPASFNREIPPLAMSNLLKPSIEMHGARLELQTILYKLRETIQYADQKLTAFENSKLFKSAGKVEDILELQTNLSYIVSYASGQFSAIVEKNGAEIAELKSVIGIKDNNVAEDELELLEDRPACINLDSDDEDAAKPAPTSILRCKTVTEINGLNVPRKKTIPKAIIAKRPITNGIPLGPIKATPAPAIPTQKPNDVIDLDDFDDELPVSNEEIVKDILSDLIDSLFISAGGNKENAQNSDATGDLFCVEILSKDSPKSNSQEDMIENEAEVGKSKDIAHAEMLSLDPQNSDPKEPEKVGNTVNEPPKSSSKEPMETECKNNPQDASQISSPKETQGVAKDKIETTEVEKKKQSDGERDRIEKGSEQQEQLNQSDGSEIEIICLDDLEEMDEANVEADASLNDNDPLAATEESAQNASELDNERDPIGDDPICIDSSPEKEKDENSSMNAEPTKIVDKPDIVSFQAVLDEEMDTQENPTEDNRAGQEDSVAGPLVPKEAESHVVLNADKDTTSEDKMDVQENCKEDDKIVSESPEEKPSNAGVVTVKDAILEEMVIQADKGASTSEEGPKELATDVPLNTDGAVPSEEGVTKDTPEVPKENGEVAEDKSDISGTGTSKEVPCQTESTKEQMDETDNLTSILDCELNLEADLAPLVDVIDNVDISSIIEKCEGVLADENQIQES